MSGCFVGSKEIENGRDSVERKSVFGKGMGGEVEVGFRKDGFEGNVLLSHYRSFTGGEGGSMALLHKVVPVLYPATRA